ncbi:lysylphosphatidylglycerol synthase transmembrane domain-containing protein [Changpingibacter yushuensis]|uniref:lysylphosphatidylglycerol synthase transmembrane domain-containing protein n=1 Tax=Changpingibacter yushuensis TaxID=2758440 RepID=UPI0015F68BD1|nr:lysylphosphatidylglycerol synthase transmembrane domain-containing protein [Changpingibacter yushuensis]
MKEEDRVPEAREGSSTEPTHPPALSTPVPAPRRNVLLIDEAVRWVRRPRDLAGAGLFLLAIISVMVLAIYGSATTLAITRDVRSATQKILETVLFIPINVIEGLLSFFLPLILLIDLVWHRQWRTLVSAVASSGSAVVIAYGMLWLFEKYFPISPLTQQLSDSIDEQANINLIPYVAVIAALLTVASSHKAWRISSWGWPLLIFALVVSVLKGNQTLPGALITVFLGCLCGLLARYIAGDVPERSTGAHLVNIVRRAGIDVTQIVRIDKLPEDSPLYAWRTITEAPLGYVDRYGLEQIRQILKDTEEMAQSGLLDRPQDPPTDGGELLVGGVVDDGEALPRPDESEPESAIHRKKAKSGYVSFRLDPEVDPDRLSDALKEKWHPPISVAASRNYIVTDVHGTAYIAGLIDTDQHIMGVLASMWNRLTLTIGSQRPQRTIEESADRVVMMELAATHAGLAPERNLRVASGTNSMLVTYKLRGETAFHAMTDAPLDATLDETWAILQKAHQRGFCHGNVGPRSVVMHDGHVEILNWERGSLAASELTRRIDMAQAIALMASHAGVERAVASAQRCLPLDQMISLAPALQAAVIPHETMARFSSKKEFQRLRDSLTESVPATGEVQPLQLRRFSPRTVITLSIGLVAVYLLLASINIEELRDTISQAVPAWMVFSFIAGMFSYVGASLVLKAYTAENLNFKTTTIVQLAASVVALVAPAGIGPAALNLRFLQKNKVATPVAIATVSLVQVAQFVTTVALLVLLGLATGDVGSFAVPSGTILVVVACVAVVAAAFVLVTPLRKWASEKIRPTIDQIWPRLVWLGTHPIRFFYGFCGSVLQSVAYVAAFGGALAAFGHSLPVVTLAVTYLVSNSVGSVVPSPGGIGPVEAALTVGLTAAGVPYSIAFSTALLFRVLTFWIRIPLGWLALNWCQRRNVV